MLPLIVSAPACYETFAGSILCLGLVDNPLDYAVESVMVEVMLIPPDGVSLVEISTVEQTVIPSGGFAPYQALFDAQFEDYDDAATAAYLINGLRVTSDDWVTLTVEDADGQLLDDGRYVISAAIFNPSTSAAELTRAVVTLQDEGERVIGYRVVTFGDAGVKLEAGARFPLRIMVTPQVVGVVPKYQLYVEARKSAQ